uniref:RxLR effector protein n=1 Tax=Helicotheca tamesis TaxID=374047 RepID=A0A7S2MJQ8_9STRA|mmetsp:Transcript_17202/g.23647  ORF Transcript_17202/g.23647 Transcript_17202/m.23647 type:complete len:171 (+) Transcript_17202:174-686(+)|eukprot:CAMPEP_0185724238 /NCGR_PEP_ID=MMETSP1171-20130828/782_1 /TAXON_ID=374046 /ORGANISM="Helicotheca tamensis, Strain CCMP826" /LENGTH=170 /DNA_ID=CAMNT_0028392045 /DNA_START=148 /DNA_END=660 /DNA_ORIENTATION=-
MRSFTPKINTAFVALATIMIMEAIAFTPSASLHNSYTSMVVSNAGSKSRIFQSSQEDLEKREEVRHLTPDMNDEFLVERGITKGDIPRGASSDNSDAKGANKIDWNDIDKKFKEKEEQFLRDSVHWIGKKAPITGSSAGKQPTRAATARAIAASARHNNDKSQKKFFGWL